jgi:alginate O-acetyltransferase complex protein AlgI
MLFNSFEFLIFFPVVTILFFLLPHKFRWMLLLAASCVFYMFFVPVYILILLVTILIDYVAAIYIDKSEGKKKKFYLIISITSTCLVLFIFKYFNFFNENFRLLAQLIHWNYPIQALRILLPIGLSFHTFQSLSYVIEVYRGNQKPEHHFGIYSLYVMFYPQLSAGPIERPQNMLHQFYEEHDFDYDNVMYGLKRMLWGYFKKVVIADRLSLYVNAIYGDQNAHNGTSFLLATIFFTFQIYCDFSGYSDIAIGSARVMGFKLMTNFNRPLFSKSMTEYWRRWHISLSTWFNDYLFTPLVFEFRNAGKFAVVFALLITFFVSGLWHGAGWTFIAWGLLHGIAIMYEFLTKKKRKRLFQNVPELVSKTVSSILTLIFVSFTLIFFRASSFHDAIIIIHKMIFERGRLFIGGNTWLIVYSVFFILVLLVTELIQEYKLFNNFSLFYNPNKAVRYLTYYSLVLIILLLGVFDSSQFIYFQF